MYLQTHPKPAVNIINALDEIVGPLTPSQRMDIEILLRDAIDEAYHDDKAVEEQVDTAIRDEIKRGYKDAQRVMADAIFNVRINSKMCPECQDTATRYINDECFELTGEVATTNPNEPKEDK